MLHSNRQQSIEKNRDTEDVRNLLYSRKTTDFTTREILKLHYFAHLISI